MMSQELVREVARALKQNQALPNLTADIGIDQAYQIQHEVTKVRSPEGIIGVKAGVTSEPVQKFFGLDHALIASLYHGSRLASGAEISSLEGRVIESEVALKLDAAGNPVAIAPALEIAAVRFAAKEQTTAGNLVICNLGADVFVVGEFVPWSQEYNDITMTLHREETVVNETPMSVALGGPGPGAAWVHKEALKRGFSLHEDMVFMMGSCGAVVPAEPGRYLGDYGKLGTVELIVT